MTHTVWVVDRPGGEFRRETRPRPQLHSGEVLIAIAASGINPLDTKIRNGMADHAKHSLPAVLGLDMAGTVLEVGPGVENFEPGDEVYGAAGGVGGLQGTLAEMIAADAALLALKPRNLSMRQAAALPLGTITAWEGLVDRAKVHKGHKVLIHAGAGGVGHVAVQIAKSFGADVYATVSPDKADLVRGLKAEPIDYLSVKADEYVARYTDGAGFDIIFDTVGGATLDTSFSSVKRHTGHVLSILGWGTHSLAPLSFRGATYSGVFTLLPLLTGQGRVHHGEILRAATALAESDQLRPLLHQRRFAIDDIESAYSAVTSSPAGKVVLEFT